MGFKDQIAEAKKISCELLQDGLTVKEVCNKLNEQLDSFYFVQDNRIYCENFFDCYPAVRIT